MQELLVVAVHNLGRIREDDHGATEVREDVVEAVNKGPGGSLRGPGREPATPPAKVTCSGVMPSSQWQSAFLTSAMSHPQRRILGS